jgi:HSP20 family protein
MSFFEDWDPAKDLERFRTEIDDLLERFRFRAFRPKELKATALVPSLESFVDDGKFIVRLDVPGVDPKDIEVNVVEGMLNVRAKREETQEIKKKDFIRREVRYGSFERTMALPKGVKPEDVKASYGDGVLELTAPMPKEMIAKQVKVPIQQAAPKKVEAREKVETKEKTAA